MAKLKVILIGQANVGKTSIGKYLIFLDRAIALNTEPSTRVEKYMLKVLKADISLFVTPGQRRFQRTNIEFLLNLLDENTVILYVMDAAAKRERIKLMLKEFVDILKLMSSAIKDRKIDSITIALLAHKQDLPNALNAEKILQSMIEKMKSVFPNIRIYVFNTSIYYPESLFRVVREIILPKALPMKTLEDIVDTLAKLTGSRTVVISDSMGFPLAMKGDEKIGSWLSIIPAKLLTSLEHEKRIIRDFRKDLWDIIFGVGDDESIDIIMDVGSSTKAYISIRKIDDRPICFSLFNPKKQIDVIRGIISGASRKLVGIMNNIGVLGGW